MQRTEAMEKMKKLAIEMKTSNDRTVQLAAASLCVILAAVENRTTDALATLLLLHVTGSEDELRIAAAIGGSTDMPPPKMGTRKH